MWWIIGSIYGLIVGPVNYLTVFRNGLLWFITLPVIVIGLRKERTYQPGPKG